MSDPLDRLADLRVDDLPVPLAAAVRARGDRLRRRRYAVAAGGAALAVVLATAPFAVLAQGGDRSATDPAAPTEPTASAMAEELRTVLTAADLPVVPRPGFGAWREVGLSTALPTLACVSEQGLPVDPSPEQWLAAQGFTLPDESGTVLGRARLAAYRFADGAAATAAAEQVRATLTSCPGVPDASVGDPVELDGEDVGVAGATGVTREVVDGAPEACGGDCDAAWFDQQSVVRLDDTLVLLSWAEVAGPAPPEGGEQRAREFLALTLGRLADGS